MTLNITVLSDQAIYQSSDFILWDPKLKKATSMKSTKTVQVSTVDGFYASVAYAGVGSLQGIDTSDWVAKWLTQAPVASFTELVQVVQDKGSKWLRDIQRHSGQPLRGQRRLVCGALTSPRRVPS